MNCTALFEAGRLTVWAPTQAPSIARDEAAKAAGIAPGQVEIRSTLMGGGFGRRAEMDFVIEAAHAAMAVPGRPVKLTWSREEDLRHDMYRPAATGRVRGVLGSDGRIAALDYTLASESVVASNFRRTPSARGGDAAKDKSALGGAFSPRYALPIARMAYVPRDDGIPTGFWRGVSNSINPFLLESFMDELAASASVDPVAFRLHHLEGLPAEQAVLRAAARLGRWGQPLPSVPGRRFGRGVAFFESHDSLVGQVVEVSVADDGALRVERVACVVDCRSVVHPAAAEAQITGGILDALNVALQGRITIRGGAVEQGNFNDYPWLRLADIPEIVVELLPQGGRPGGMGEPGVPGIAPALANAIFAATGQRLRTLPVGATVGAPSGATASRENRVRESLPGGGRA
jgi:isoquinoline 1-oxidoreductase beta subunit